MSHKDAADILEQAADVIDTYGWKQLDIGSISDGFCAIGALRQAAWVDGKPANRAAYARAMSSLQAKVFTVAGFNDTPKRTQGEVTDLLRSTAKDLRNEA